MAEQHSNSKVKKPDPNGDRFVFKKRDIKIIKKGKPRKPAK